MPSPPTPEAVQTQRKILGQLADGTPVYQKPGADFLANNTGARELLPELFAACESNEFTGDDLLKVVQFGRTVGLSMCVETTAKDEITYRRRKGRQYGCSRLVRNREGTPCSSAVIILHRNQHEEVILMTAYIADQIAPPEPCSPSGRVDEQSWLKACSFWRTHALVSVGDFEEGFFTESFFFGTRPRK